MLNTSSAAQESASDSIDTSIHRTTHTAIASPPIPSEAHGNLTATATASGAETADAYAKSCIENVPQPVKLFVGQVPRTIEEEELTRFLEMYGELSDVVIIRDKMSGIHRGCAFASFVHAEDAQRAIEELHNQVTIPPSMNPLQVRPADGQAGAIQEHKLFIGMIPKTADEADIRQVFEKFGVIEEVFILRQPASGQSKACAFLKFKEREAALEAIDEINGKVTMHNGVSPLVVKFADSKRQRMQRIRNFATTPTGYWQMPMSAGGNEVPAQGVAGTSVPYAQIQQFQQQYMQQLQTFGVQNRTSNVLPLTNSVPTGPTDSYAFYNPYAFAYGNISPYESSTSSSIMENSDNISPPPSGESLPCIDSTTIALETAPHSTTQLEGPIGANLFIYHLPHDLTDADLATAFAPFGTVISAKVYMDKLTGESKGFGFVSYDSAEAADNAIVSMNGFQIGSKRLKVQHKRIHSNAPMQNPSSTYSEYNPTYTSNISTYSQEYAKNFPAGPECAMQLHDTALDPAMNLEQSVQHLSLEH